MRGKLHRGQGRLIRVPMGDFTDQPGVTRAASAEHRSALQSLLPHILKTFQREPALALTAAYLLVALAGIFYNYSFFERGFGIPVLTLSQIGDFLVAGLQQPIALALMLSTFVVCWLFDLINHRSRRRSIAKETALRARQHLPWWRSLQLRWLAWHNRAAWIMQLMFALVVIGYGWIFVSIYANNRAQAVRRGDVPRVEIRLVGEPADLYAADPKGWGYLGAVSNYVFLYDPTAKRSLVLPVNAIERIQPEQVAPAPGGVLPVVHLP